MASTSPPASAGTDRTSARAGSPLPGTRSASRGTTVLVDARGLLTSGIGRYVREVLAAVLADPRVSGVKLLGDPAVLRDFALETAGGGKATTVPYDHGFYSPAAQAAWLALRARGAVAADVAFFPHYDAPALGMPARSVLTVHDLIHFKVPEAFAAWRRAAAGLLLHRGVTAAARIIAVSEATRRDLVERIPAAADRVVVVPNGVAPFFGAAAGDVAPAGAGIRGAYLLCVGNRKPHKNLEGAVATLAHLAADRPELRLVIVGETYPGWSAVLERADALGVRGRIVELSGVDDARLRALYAGCEALLFLSLYEGFGLPVLEAMAAGAPVVASDRSSIPEVVGDAGVLVDPRDPAAAAAAVLRLSADPEHRREMVRRGRARAAGFTWERAGRATADVLHEVAIGRPAAPGRS